MPKEIPDGLEEMSQEERDAIKEMRDLGESGGSDDELADVFAAKAGAAAFERVAKETLDPKSEEVKREERIEMSADDKEEAKRRAEFRAKESAARQTEFEKMSTKDLEDLKAWIESVNLSDKELDAIKDDGKRAEMQEQFDKEQRFLRDINNELNQRTAAREAGKLLDEYGRDKAYEHKPEAKPAAANNESLAKADIDKIKQADAEAVERAKRSEAELAAKMGYKPIEQPKPAGQEKTAKENAEAGIKYWTNDLKEAKTDAEKFVAQKNLEKYKKDLEAVSGKEAPAKAEKTSESAGTKPAAEKAPVKPAEAPKAPEASQKAEQPKKPESEKKPESGSAAKTEAPRQATSPAATYSRPAAGSLFSTNFESASEWFSWLNSDTEKKLDELESIPMNGRSRFMKFIKSRFKFGVKQLKRDAKAWKKQGNKFEYDAAKMRIKQEKTAFREFNRGAHRRGLQWINPLNPFNYFRSENYWLSNKPVFGSNVTAPEAAPKSPVKPAAENTPQTPSEPPTPPAPAPFPPVTEAPTAARQAAQTPPPAPTAPITTVTGTQTTLDQFNR